MNDNNKLKARVNAAMEKLPRTGLIPILTAKFPELVGQEYKIQNVIYKRQVDEGITVCLEKMVKLLKPKANA